MWQLKGRPVSARIEGAAQGCAGAFFGRDMLEDTALAKRKKSATGLGRTVSLHR
jgi:hypothetical protein